MKSQTLFSTWLALHTGNLRRAARRRKTCDLVPFHVHCMKPTHMRVPENIRSVAQLLNFFFSLLFFAFSPYFSLHGPLVSSPPLRLSAGLLPAAGGQSVSKDLS